MCFRPSAATKNEDIKMVRCENCGQFVAVNATQCSICGEKVSPQENIEGKSSIKIL